MKNKEHVLLCILGESSSGKDTLANKLCETNNYSQLISYSTRPRRDGEGDTHLFVDDDTYEAMLKDNQVAAYTVINDCKYWCTIDQLYNTDIYIIDPKGVEVLKSLNLPNLRLVTVYINVPKELRKERAMKRGDNINTYKSRSLSERQQFYNMKKEMAVDYVVSNIDFSKAFSILKWICNVEGLFMNYKEDTTE